MDIIDIYPTKGALQMCTRYFIEPETPELMEILESVQRSGLCIKFQKAGYAITTAGEVRPMNVVPVIASGMSGARRIFPMRWGFQMQGRNPLVNARSETAKEKPTFRECWQKRRCIIPASWYYEWEHFTDASGRTKAGDKYMIQPAGAAVTWLCGIYRMEGELPVFTVLTREPSAQLRLIHDRMPLILPQELTSEWIRPDADPDELVRHALTDMVIEKAG